MTQARRSPGRRAADALPKVPCPHCGCSVSIVTSSRPVLSRNGVRRRRECEDCRGRFTTIETIYLAGTAPAGPTEAGPHVATA